VKRVLWIFLAVGIALAGAWGYGELVRRENDTGQPLRLLAIGAILAGFHLGGLFDEAVFLFPARRRGHEGEIELKGKVPPGNR
jgi:hypothetical protein